MYIYVFTKFKYKFKIHMNTLLKDKVQKTRMVILVECHMKKIHIGCGKNHFPPIMCWLQTLIENYGNDYKLMSFGGPIHHDETREGSLLLIKNQIQMSNMYRHPTIASKIKIEHRKPTSMSEFTDSKPDIIVYSASNLFII